MLECFEMIQMGIYNVLMSLNRNNVMLNLLHCQQPCQEQVLFAYELYTWVS